MYVADFSGPEQLQVLELVEPGTEVVAIQHRRHVGMGRRARHLEERRQRGDEWRSAHEFNPERHVELLGYVARFMHVSRAGLIVVQSDFLSAGRRGINTRKPERGKHLASLFEIIERLGACGIWLPEAGYARRAMHGGQSQIAE